MPPPRAPEITRFLALGLKHLPQGQCLEAHRLAYISRFAHFLSAYPSRYFNPYASSEYDYFHTDSMDRIVTPLAMKRALKEMSWRGLIAPLPQDTPNLLVFNNFTANQRFDFWDEEEEMFFFEY